MTPKTYLSIFILLFVTFECSHGKLPSSIKVCNKNETNMSGCIMNAIKAIQPQLVTGDLGDGFVVPSIDPFALDKLELGNGKDFKVSISKLKMKGASGFVIDKLRANVNDFKFDVLITLPKLDLTGRYDLHLILLGAPINSRGDIFMKFDNYRARVSMKATKYTKNGGEYARFGKIDIKVHPGKVRYFKLTNLFNGQKGLEEIVNAAITDNSGYMLENVYPSLEKNLGEHFTKVANEILSQATIDELFPN